MKTHYVKKLELKNFTVFSENEFTFSKGINVIIGDNSTGKTHILKLLYCLLWGEQKQFDSLNTGNIHNFLMPKKLEPVFKPDKGNLGKLVRHNYKKSFAYITFYGVNKKQGISIFSNGDMQEKMVMRKEKLLRNNLVFIPCRDISSWSPNMLSEIEKRYLEIDDTYKDLLVNLFAALLRTEDNFVFTMKAIIEKITNGTVYEQDQAFYLVDNKTGNKTKFAMLSEGFCKLGVLWRLIANGSIEQGSIILWDEPDSNINPANYQAIAKLIKTMEENSIQLFITTHNYAFVKYVDSIINKSVNIKYHNLYKSNNKICYESSSVYGDLEYSKIDKSYENLFNIVYDLQ